MEDKKYIFIGGLHRSGTTMFARCLAQHPEISAFHNTNVPEDEGQFLQTVYPTDNFYGGPGRFCFDAEAHLTEKSEILTEEAKNRIHREWENKWDGSKKVFIDKSPPTIIQSRFIQEIFPNSYFIFITRHPVATSLATHKWSGTGIYSLLNHWLYAHTIMKDDLSYLNKVKIVSYESFVECPGEVLSDMARFIGMSEYQFKPNVRTDVNEKYFDRWRKVFLQTEDRSKPDTPPEAVHAHNDKHFNFNFRRALRRYMKKRMFGDERQLSHTVYESQDAIAMFEKKVNMFGYSLVDFKKIPTL